MSWFYGIENQFLYKPYKLKLKIIFTFVEKKLYEKHRFSNNYEIVLQDVLAILV